MHFLIPYMKRGLVLLCTLVLKDILFAELDGCTLRSNQDQVRNGPIPLDKCYLSSAALPELPVAQLVRHLTSIQVTQVLIQAGSLFIRPSMSFTHNTLASVLFKVCWTSLIPCSPSPPAP